MSALKELLSFLGLSVVGVLLTAVQLIATLAQLIMTLVQWCFQLVWLVSKVLASPFAFLFKGGEESVEEPPKRGLSKEASVKLRIMLFAVAAAVATIIFVVSQTA